MALERILVAYDGSDSAKRALDMAANIAGPSPETVIDLINVVAIPMLTDEQMVNFASILDMMEADAEELLQEAVKAFDEAGIENEVATLLIKGVDPAAELAKLTEQEHYDLIIMGSRGLTGLKGYLGSVSHKVLNTTDTPVLVVK